jgi:hypothetical protein
VLLLSGPAGAENIPLTGPTFLPRSLHPNAVDKSEKGYAEVAWDDHLKAMILINRSKDTWSLRNGKKIGPGDQIELGRERITIFFTPNLAGTLEPAAATN